MSSSEGKNLAAIAAAIDQHNANCPFPAVAVAMNPFEVERLGWESIKGLPIRPDPEVGTGRFRIICAREEPGFDEQEVEAVSREYVPVES